MLYKEFYSELGKLLYAIANVDGIVSSQEKETLKNIVFNELKPYEKHTDGFGTNAALFTSMEFDILEDQIADSQPAFESFLNFVEEHHTAFDQRILDLSKKVARELANSYYKTNKKEKELIHQLIHTLEKIKPIPGKQF